MSLRRFVAYVDLARNGKNAPWRIVLGIVLILLVGIVASVVCFGGGLVILALRDGYPLTHLDTQDIRILMEDRIGLFATLLTNASLWVGVWLAMMILHRRSIRDLLGAERKLYWRDFVRAAAVTFIVGLVAGPVGAAIDPTAARTDVSLLEWVAWAPLVLVLCFLQTSAEEVVFRGYLHQTLAARFARPLIWLALPTVLFTLIHWEGDALATMNAALLLIILAMSLSMTALLIASGNLGAAMGMHFGNNISVVLLVSNTPQLGSAALFFGRSLADHGWTPWQATLFGLYGVLTVVISLGLLLHRSSPFRLRSLR